MALNRMLCKGFSFVSPNVLGNPKRAYKPNLNVEPNPAADFKLDFSNE